MREINREDALKRRETKEAEYEVRSDTNPSFIPY